MKLLQKLFKLNELENEPKKLIKQRHRYDCDVACIAMFSGKTYDDIKDKYFPSHDFNYVNVRKVEFEAIMYDLKIKIIRSQTFDPLKDAIVVVPSINTPRKLHTVFWDAKNKEVCDPQRDVYWTSRGVSKPLKFYTKDKFLNCKKLASFQAKV